jgi:hypothetical protein
MRPARHNFSGRRAERLQRQSSRANPRHPASRFACPFPIAKQKFTSSPSLQSNKNLLLAGRIAPTTAGLVAHAQQEPSAFAADIGELHPHYGQRILDEIAGVKAFTTHLKSW